MHTSLLEAIVATLSWGAGMYFETGQAPGQAGHHHPLSSPYGRFRAEDGYLNIAAGNPTMFGKLAVALGHPQWADDERFSNTPARLINRAVLTECIEAVLATRTVDHWVQVLNAAGVPTDPVLDMAQVFADPQVLARGMLRELPHAEIGTFKTTGLATKLSDTPGAIDRAPPLHGEHTDAVLQQLGIDAEERAALRGRGVIG